MSIALMVVIGVMVGTLAQLLMPIREPGGFILTLVLAIAGSLAAGLLGRALAFGFSGPAQRAVFFVSTAGSMLLLFGYRMIRQRT